MTTTRQRFSIVTVTLNCVDDAVRTAQSVLAQGFTDYEYIVKDGGSTDGTPERLRALDARVTVIVSPDSGIYDAMNQALDHCHGEYIYFLNAGDTLYDSATLGRLAEQIDPQTDIVYCNLMLHPMRQRSDYPGTLSRYYLFRKNLNHQAWLARREAYLALGRLKTSYKYCADQEFIWNARFRHELRFQHVDMLLANFVYGGVSTSIRNRAVVDRERWRLLFQYFAVWEIVVYGLASLYFLNPLKVRIARKLLAWRGITF
jgi:putative colanic acid biosynthesis glycosyltransferase